MHGGGTMINDETNERWIGTWHQDNLHGPAEVTAKYSTHTVVYKNGL